MGDGQPTRLQVDDIDHDEPPPPLAEQVRAVLHRAGRPRSRAALRRQLRVNNARLGEALRALEQRGLVVRAPDGWALSSLNGQPLDDPEQLALC